MRSRLYLIRRVVLGAVLGVVLLAASAVLLSFIFEDKIKMLAIKEVNKVLVAKVEIRGSDINFSFLQHFPLASVTFDNFIVKDPIGDGDLALAKSLSVQFNPFDVFFGKYEIKRILLKDATLNLRIDKHGKPNYIIWKIDSTATGDDPISLQLKNISLLRVKVNFDDAQSTLSFQNDIKEAFLTGKLYDENFLLDTKADIYFSRFSMNKTQYIKHQRIIFDAALDMDMLQQKYTIKEGLATVNHAEFDVTGYAQNLSNSVKVDYTIKSKQNKIQTLMALMPEEYAVLFKDYESEGAVYFTALIKGLISDVENPSVNVNFGVKNGRLVDKVNNIALEQLNCQGTYSNGKKHTLEDSEAELKNFSCMLKGKKITASLYGRNLLDPYIRAEVKGSAELADVKHFLPVTYIDKLEGFVSGNVAFKGKVNDLKTQKGRSKVFISGSMQMKNVAVASKQYSADYTKMNGKFVFDGNDLTIENFSGMAKTTDFAMKGEFKNLAAFVLLPDQKFYADAHFHSNHLRLEDFMVTLPVNDKNNTATTQFTFPTFLLANLNVTIDKFTFKRITATQLAGNVIVNEKDVNIKKGELTAFGGKMQLTGNITTLPKNRLRSAFTGSCQDIEVSQLFYALEDFGQEQLTHKNISGTLTSKTNFSLDWNADLSPELPSVVATSEFVIDNGKLQNMAPLQKLGKFADVSNLNPLTFSRMSNTLYVRDEQIFIPKMDIRSSAMDMTVSGTHTFSNIMDFHVTMNVSQLVFGKRKSYEDEFGAVEVNERGGAILYVKMSGPISDPKISYDGAHARKQLKENIKQEVKQINNLLKGTGPDGKPRENLNKPQKDYELEWEKEDSENSTQKSSNSLSPDNSTQKNDPAAKAWKNFKKKFSTEETK